MQKQNSTSSCKTIAGNIATDVVSKIILTNLLYHLTNAPLFVPTNAPTVVPTDAPTFLSTETQTFEPTDAPTIEPTIAPTIAILSTI
jgi:hypothetical protein